MCDQPTESSKEPLSEFLKSPKETFSSLSSSLSFHSPTHDVSNQSAEKPCPDASPTRPLPAYEEPSKEERCLAERRWMMEEEIFSLNLHRKTMQAYYEEKLMKQKMALLLKFEELTKKGKVKYENLLNQRMEHYEKEMAEEKQALSKRDEEKECLIEAQKQAEEIIKREKVTLENLQQEFEIYKKKAALALSKATEQMSLSFTKEFQTTEIVAEIERLSSLLHRVEAENGDLGKEVKTWTMKHNDQVAAYAEMKAKFVDVEAKCEELKTYYENVLQKTSISTKEEAKAYWQTKIKLLKEEFQTQNDAYEKEISDVTTNYQTIIQTQEDRIKVLEKYCNSLEKEFTAQTTANVSSSVLLSSKENSISDKPTPPCSREETLSTPFKKAQARPQGLPPSPTASAVSTAVAPSNVLPLPAIHCISCINARQDILNLRKAVRDAEQQCSVLQRCTDVQNEKMRKFKTDLQIAHYQLKLSGKNVEEILYLKNLIKRCFSYIPVNADPTLEELMKVVYYVLELPSQEIDEVEKKRAHDGSDGREGGFSTYSVPFVNRLFGS